MNFTRRQPDVERIAHARRRFVVVALPERTKPLDLGETAA